MHGNDSRGKATMIIIKLRDKDILYTSFIDRTIFFFFSFLIAELSTNAMWYCFRLIELLFRYIYTMIIIAMRKIVLKLKTHVFDNNKFNKRK